MAKRVLIYTNHFYPENFKVNEIASLLDGEGFEVTVITGLPNYPSGVIYEGFGVFQKSKKYLESIVVKRLLLIPRGSGSKLRLVINYLSYFLSCIFYTLYISVFKKKYDVVFVHHTSPILIAFPPLIYKWIRGAKLILWDLDMWPDTLVAMAIITHEKIIAFLERLIGWLYRRYDHILIGSKSFIAKAASRVSPEKISYFPNWAERVFTDKHKVSVDLGLKFPEGFKVMYAGNIGAAQDFESVLETMLILKDTPVTWLFVGDGRKRKWLEQEIKTHGISHRVRFYGSHPLETMPYFFSQADVLFFSLKDEALFSKTVPAKLQAYMASSKPIIGMISGEGRQLIIDSKCGLSVNSGDFKGFAEAITTLRTASAPDLEAYSKNGSAYYERHFSLHSRSTQLLKLLND